MPFHVPGNDFPIPGVDWKTEVFEDLMGLVIGSFWALLIMFQLKLCGKRNMRSSHSNKPIIVKASTKPDHRDAIAQYLTIPEVRQAIERYRWLSDKTMEWWVNMSL